MLTLTITDPHMLTTAERQAILAFVQITGVNRPDPLERIADADRPDTGRPAAPTAEVVAVIPPAPGSAVEFVVGLDPAAIFGGQKSAADVPSVPAIPTPPAPAEAVSGSTSAPAPTAGAHPAGVDVDSKGLPWDVRIHASTKNKNADGAWKKRKNTPEETVTQIETELRALMAIPVGAIAAGTVPPPPVPGAIPTPPAGDGTPTTFPSLMEWVTRAVADLKLTQADVAATVAPIGLASVIGLNARPDLIPEVYQKLRAIADAKGAA